MCRFFFGRNKVMALAFGTGEADEKKPGLHKLGDAISGNVGVLFTNKEPADVQSWFAE